MESLPEGFPDGVKYTEIRLIIQYSYFVLLVPLGAKEHKGYRSREATRVSEWARPTTCDERQWKFDLG